MAPLDNDGSHAVGVVMQPLGGAVVRHSAGMASTRCSRAAIQCVGTPYPCCRRSAASTGRPLSSCLPLLVFSSSANALQLLRMNSTYEDAIPKEKYPSSNIMNAALQTLLSSTQRRITRNRPHIYVRTTAQMLKILKILKCKYMIHRRL